MASILDSLVNTQWIHTDSCISTLERSLPQVFKHHKEKYLKRREMEEKYNSCPVQTSPDLEKIGSPKYIRTFVKRVSSMLTPSSKPRVLMRKGRDYFGSTSSVYINFDSPEVGFVLLTIYSLLVYF